MRGTVAKALRRQAKLASVGLPARKLTELEHTVTRTAVNKKTGEKKPVKITVYQTENDPRSTRGIYRALKKGKQP